MPLDFFQMTFGFSWAFLVAQTNLYANFRNVANCIPVTEPEMMAFVGVLKVMGIDPCLQLTFTGPQRIIVFGTLP